MLQNKMYVCHDLLAYGMYVFAVGFRATTLPNKDIYLSERLMLLSETLNQAKI